MLSNELEACLNDAFQMAREGRHEFLTVEHLLYSILETPRVREILRACGGDVPKLRQELKEHIEQTTPRLKAGEDRSAEHSFLVDQKKKAGTATLRVALYRTGTSTPIRVLQELPLSLL